MTTRASGSIFDPGLILQGRYRLDEPLASGGMAEVWKGNDMVLQRHVAIKLLHPHLAADSNLASRFQREAVAAAKLSHPHIVPTFDAGQERGVFYIVMGLVTGPSLSELMKSRDFNQDQVAEIGRQVADALDYAHKSGLIHRDIKPANVLIVDGNRVMLADFGIGKAVAETTNEATLPGLVVGTPGYIPPEQLKGDPIDARADIYALGVLLHEMLCGHKSVDQPTAITSVDDLKNNAAEKCPDIPKPINDVIEKATATKPDDRYQTAGKMRDELVRVELVLREQRGENRPDNSADDDTPSPRLSAVGAASNDTSEHPVISPVGGRYDPIPAQKAANHRGIVTLGILVLLVVLAIGVGLAVKGLAHSVHSNSTAKSKTNTTAAITIGGASSFDPFGSDHLENESQTNKAVDGDPSTSWATEGYSNNHFGNLKAGVGLIIHVNEGAKPKQIQIDSPSNGWAASIYSSTGAPTSIGAWGTQNAGQDNLASGTTTWQLNGAAGNNLLIWITNLGSANKVSISEVRVTS